ncbi:DUF982 domain-containing protein [Mesorhizobium sp. ArgA1]
MDDLRLQIPVAIAVGAGFKRNIATLAEMHNFLKEWPQARRGKIYDTALRACEKARAGHLTKDQARRAFTAFAETAGIAWTGIDPVTALRLAKAGTGRLRHTRASAEIIASAAAQAPRRA